MIESTSALILCGGLGTRLRSAVSDRSKSMALVAGRPFLEIQIAQLRRQGITRIVLGSGFMGKQIANHFGDGRGFGVEVAYSRESSPLGTGGALRLAEPLLSDPVLVLNGDSYVDFEARVLLERMEKCDVSFVMALYAVPDVSRYGSVKLADAGSVEAFVEKGGNSGPGLINAGVYVIRLEVIRSIPPGRNVSLEQEILPGLVNCGIYGVVCSGRFIDIGIPADYNRAQSLLTPDAC